MRVGVGQVGVDPGRRYNGLVSPGADEVSPIWGFRIHQVVHAAVQYCEPDVLAEELATHPVVEPTSRMMVSSGSTRVQVFCPMAIFSLL